MHPTTKQLTDYGKLVHRQRSMFLAGGESCWINFQQSWLYATESLLTYWKTHAYFVP